MSVTADAEALHVYLADPQHWTKGPGVGGRQGCLITAVCWLVDDCGSAREEALLDCVRRAIGELYPEHLYRDGAMCAWFNDHPTTSHGDIVRVCERTARLAREAEDANVAV